MVSKACCMYGSATLCVGVLDLAATIGFPAIGFNECTWVVVFSQQLSVYSVCDSSVYLPWLILF